MDFSLSVSFCLFFATKCYIEKKLAWNEKQQKDKNEHQVNEYTAHR